MDDDNKGWIGNDLVGDINVPVTKLIGAGVGNPDFDICRWGS